MSAPTDFIIERLRGNFDARERRVREGPAVLSRLGGVESRREIFRASEM
jgi:hypothetical protein